MHLSNWCGGGATQGRIPCPFARVEVSVTRWWARERGMWGVGEAQETLQLAWEWLHTKKEIVCKRSWAGEDICPQTYIIDQISTLSSRMNGLQMASWQSCSIPWQHSRLALYEGTGVQFISCYVSVRLCISRAIMHYASTRTYWDVIGILESA